jgi:iron complex transport system ATP-binding protein
MSESRAFEVADLSVTLGGRPVLEKVSLHARYGEVTAVLGPNGAGKSTLLRAIAGLVAIRGSVLVGGRALEEIGSRERAKLVSFVPQQSMLRAAMPVRQVVALGRYTHRDGFEGLSRLDLEAVEDAMRETDIAHLGDRVYTELSSGEQKRVMIARSLATGARTLLLDEPSASLDVEHSLRLFLLLRSLASQGRCIVVVLHHLDEALQFADRCALIKAGQLLAHGVTAEIIEPQRVRTVYGVEMIHGGGLGFRLPESPT